MAKKLTIIIMLLLLFGLIILSSAGIVDGQKKFGSTYYYLNSQLLKGILPGLFIMFLLSKVDFRFWKKLSLPILFLALFLTTLVFIPNIGYGLKGANRWINLFGASFQPSEFLKLALAIYFAAWFGGRNERIKNWTYGTAPFFIVLSFILLLLALQPDFGTLIIVLSIAFAVYFFAGGSIKHILAITLVTVLIIGVMIYVEPYRLNRIKTFLDPSIDPRGTSYQLNQSLISIGSGGVFGVGYGKSTQKYGFLPEIVNDSIFAIISEELGFVGAVATIGLFVTFIFTLIIIAKRSEDRFGQLYVMGIAAWISSQAFLNIAAIIGLAPLTGIPLPFISYGGTAIITILAGLGIVLNIAKQGK